MSNKTLSRRSFLRTAALAAAGVSLAACTTPTAAPTEAPKEEAKPTEAPKAEVKKVTLSMWTHDMLYVKFFTAVGQEQFSQAHSGTEITYDFQVVPEVFTKMLSTFSAGEPAPDLFGLEQGWFGTYTKDDIIGQKFVDLTARIGAEKDKFVPGTWAKYTSKGKIYGVESALCTCAYYYQPAVLEKAGLKELPKTWDDFMNAGIEAAKNNIYLSAIDSEGYAMFDLLFMERGGQYFDETTEFVLDKSPNREMALEVMNYLKQGIENKVFWPANGGDFWGPGLMAAHKEGKVMGMTGPDWWSDAILKANAKDQSGNWHIDMMPKWKGGGFSSSTWGGTGFCITQESKSVDLCWELVHLGYMTKDNQIKRYEMIHYLPHMYEALEDPRFTDAKDEYYGGQAIGQTWLQAAKDMPTYYQSPVRGDMGTEINKQMTTFYAGTTTAEAALDSVAKVTRQAIEDL